MSLSENIRLWSRIREASEEVIKIQSSSEESSSLYLPLTWLSQTKREADSGFVRQVNDL